MVGTRISAFATDEIEGLTRLSSDSWKVPLDGRSVVVTEVFWSYWFLAAERQAMFFRRVSGKPAPWTNDEILAHHRFTNTYRASDRVSQYLLQRVIYDQERDFRDTALRILLFKIFNRIDTWEHLAAHVGEPEVSTFDADAYAQVLDDRIDADERLYSAAYIMPNPNLGLLRKHHNHLELVDRLLKDGTIAKLSSSNSLEELFITLLGIPSFGPFLAFQYAIDLNYSPHFDFDEMDFVVPGPGALRGIKKCFKSSGTIPGPRELISAMAAEAPRFLRNTHFDDLWGRPLHLIDIQNLFCEVDKFARVAHPHFNAGGPARIKQLFVPNWEPLTLGYPPKWSLPYRADNPIRLSTCPHTMTPSLHSDSVTPILNPMVESNPAARDDMRVGAQ